MWQLTGSYERALYANRAIWGLVYSTMAVIPRGGRMTRRGPSSWLAPDLVSRCINSRTSTSDVPTGIFLMMKALPESWRWVVAAWASSLSRRPLPVRIEVKEDFCCWSSRRSKRTPALMRKSRSSCISWASPWANRTAAGSLLLASRSCS